MLPAPVARDLDASRDPDVGVLLDVVEEALQGAHPARPAELVQRLTDEQGSPIVLVRVQGN